MARRSAGGGAGLFGWLGLAGVVLLLDQFTKVLIVGNFALGEVHTVTSFFDVVRAHNHGAAFSFLSDASGWQRWFFTGLGTVAAVVIIFLLRQHAGQTLFCLAISLILGGAVGNVIDRLWHGYVIDFLQFHWSWLAPMFTQGYFPAFNLADSAITLGAVLLVLDELRRVRRS
ncbi:lipoprotein signal peptidase [Ideonella sp. 4Y16]|uniref:signal peptidase II n=1 Tax=Ideonella alba TaxID=2824118 RepID=UPI001B373156|nr:signal peptidase II [Ideonella alba]MBQ0944177.1 lipoprotein signal peptidase [Ideonella alba]